MNITPEQIDRLINAIESLSTGTPSYPSGFEALTMAISHDPTHANHESLADAINNVANGLESISTSIDNLTAAVEQLE